MLSIDYERKNISAEIAAKYRQASSICCGYPNQNKIVNALDRLGPEEQNYALVYLDGHIECASSIVQKSREIYGQYHQIKHTLALEYPQSHILLEVAARLINEGYQIKVFFDCSHSLKHPKFERYIVSQHHNRSSSYISMHYAPYGECLHIYPEEVSHLID